jgi:hypothetical protein
VNFFGSALRAKSAMKLPMDLLVLLLLTKVNLSCLRTFENSELLVGVMQTIYVLISTFQAVLGNVVVLIGCLSGMAPFIVSFLCTVCVVSGRFLMKVSCSPARRDDSDCMHITVRLGKTVLALEVPPQQQVGALKMSVAKHLGISELNAIIAVMTIHLKGKKLVGCDEMTLEEAGISSNCEVLCTLNVRGGSGSGFKSIPIRNLRRLLTAIKSDFDDWVQNEAPTYKRRFDGDPLVGKKVIWDGFSGSIQYYFKEKNIDPCERYKELYSNQRHSIAVSYVWSATSLHQMAGEWPLARPDHMFPFYFCLFYGC